jgi:iron-sulfur cluster repair protein YtfE (RIC family)
MTNPPGGNLTPDPTLALDRRTGWPADLRVLLEQHPRATWPSHPNLGALCQFWLERHAMFRQLAEALAQGADSLREAKVEAAEFQPWFTPRMRFFLQQLHHHHLIEDHNYFPVFMRAEKRLARGFQVLEADHGVIDGAIRELASASDGLLAALRAPAADLPRATAALGGLLPGFLQQLDRHLDDEEDLIIPLILERSEAGLGVA